MNTQSTLLGDGMEMVEMSVETALLRLLPQLASNRRHALDEIRAWRLKGCQEKTIYKHFICLLPFMRLYADKDWLRLGRREIEDYMLWLQKAQQYAPYTKEDMKRSVKRFYSDFGKWELVEWIRLHRKSKGIPRECLLTPEEVGSLIANVKAKRDKAIIAVSYDAGLRPGELVSIKTGCLELTHDPVHLTVTGKTGTRTIPISYSVPYLVDYLDSTPRLAPDRCIWVREEKCRRPGVLEYAGIRKMLREAAKEIDLGKRLYPYVFRHTRITEFANFMSERQLKKYFGTSQLDTYEHLITSDLDNVINKIAMVRVRPVERSINQMVLVH